MTGFVIALLGFCMTQAGGAGKGATEAMGLLAGILCVCFGGVVFLVGKGRE